MKNTNIIKPIDKYTLLGYTGAGELNKENKDFIKENSKYLEELKLKKTETRFLRI
jgi:hypothetical protein